MTNLEQDMSNAKQVVEAFKEQVAKRQCKLKSYMPRKKISRIVCWK